MNKRYNGFISVTSAPGTPSATAERRRTDHKPPPIVDHSIIDDFRFIYSSMGAAYYVTEMNKLYAAHPVDFTIRAHSYAVDIARRANAYSALPQIKFLEHLIGTGYQKTFKDVILESLAADDNTPGITATIDLLSVRLDLPDASLFKGLADPVTIATVYAIDSAALTSQELRNDAILHYLTLAHAESDFSSGAQSKESSAKGQLQITDATYRGAIGLARSLASWSKSYTPAFISSFYSNFPSDQGWREFNRTRPSRDSTQYLANFGLMINHLQSIANHWYFEKGWHGLKQTANQNLLLHKFSKILSDKEAGQQLLVSYYHINGPGADSIKGISYPERYPQDASYYVHLKSIPGLADFIAHNAGVNIGAITSPNPSGFIQSTMTKANLDAINRYSIKNVQPPTGNPVITSPFGKRKGDKHHGVSSNHKGVDLRAAVGTPVYAVADGVITSSYSKPGYGWGISITLRDDSDGAVIRYAHLSKIITKPGTHVKKGQIVGLSGASGTNDAHLHLELTIPKVGRVNPTHDIKSRWRFAV